MTTDTEDSTDLTHSIAGRILAVLPRMHHTLRRDRVRQQTGDGAAAVFSDRMGQYRLLSLLYGADRLTSHQLAEQMDVSAPTVSTMVRSLVDEGLVERERDADDQRVVRLTITDIGRRTVEDERRAWRDVFLARFTQLSDLDQQAIIDAVPALERLLATDPCRKES